VKFPQIRMTSQMAQIGMKQTFSKQKLHQPEADLTIEQPKADVRIQAPLGTLTIDQTEAFTDANLLSAGDLIDKKAREGLQLAASGTARRAREGSELMRIENEGKPIIMQAQRNGYRQKKDLTIDFIPSPFSVQIDYEPKDVQIDVNVNHPTITAHPRAPEHEVERGKVDIYMRQYENLHIDVDHQFTAFV